MATLAQLRSDVASYLNRRDFLPGGQDESVFPGWVLSVETELMETLRHRDMVKSAYQAIDAPFIALPPDFATMESIHDVATGTSLILKDQWSDPPWSNSCSTAYRIVANRIEFLPHPTIPDPPNPDWEPQQVLMGWYAKPRPLLLDTDSNVVLEKFYSIYRWGVIKEAALWALDQARAQQADAVYQQAVTRANLHSQQSTYSGAPYTQEMSEVF